MRRAYGEVKRQKSIIIEGGVAEMRKTIEVVYEGGVFKPLEPVELEEGEKTKITIEKGKGILTILKK